MNSRGGGRVFGANRSVSPTSGASSGAGAGGPGLSALGGGTGNNAAPTGGIGNAFGNMLIGNNGNKAQFDRLVELQQKKKDDLAGAKSWLGAAKGKVDSGKEVD